MPPVYFPQNGSHFEWVRAWACILCHISTHMRSRFSALLAAILISETSSVVSHVTVSCNIKQVPFFFLSICFLFHVKIIGDYNTRCILDVLELFDLKQHISGETHNRGHTLDLVISRARVWPDFCFSRRRSVHLRSFCCTLLPLLGKTTPWKATDFISEDSHN